MTRLWLTTGTNECELIHELSIRNHRVNRGKAKILLLRSKLGEQIAIAGMHCPQEEHHLEDWWNSHRRLRQSPQVALKQGSKLMNTLFIALSIIEKSKKGSE